MEQIPGEPRVERSMGQVPSKTVKLAKDEIVVVRAWAMLWLVHQRDIKQTKDRGHRPAEGRRLGGDGASRPGASSSVSPSPSKSRFSILRGALFLSRAALLDNSVYT